MFYKKTLLDNGITVITERMDAVRSVSLGVWFKVGSRDESEINQGLSHFMEHMMFKGTQKRDALKISQDFESIGAEQNAFTSKEHTCYYARFVDDKLPQIIEILGDMITGSVFAQEAIDSEREVVIEEIARSEDTPDDYVFELYMRAAYPDHSLGRPIIGTREVVGAFTHADCSAFSKAHYHSGNCVVVAAGSIDHEELVELCAQHLSALSKSTANKRDIVTEQKRSRCSLLKKDTEQAHIVYGMPGLSLGDKDRFAGAILDTALGGGMSSRLFQEVREKRGLAYAIYSTTLPYIGAGQFIVYAGTRPTNIEQVLSIIQSELKVMLETGITKDELERIREYVIGHIVLSSESTSQRMIRLGRSTISDIDVLSLDDLIEKYRSVNLEDVARLAKQIFDQPPTLAIISPKNTDELERTIDSLL